MSGSSLSPPKGVSTYVEDGARIAAILLVWSVIAAFFAYGVGNLGYPDGFFGRIGTHLGAVFVTVGFLNAVLYVLYRAIDYWHQH